MIGSLLVALAEPVAEHGLSEKAVEIARPFGFPITNSMVVTWIVAAGLLLFARTATRRMLLLLYLLGPGRPDVWRRAIRVPYRGLPAGLRCGRLLFRRVRQPAPAGRG